MLRLNLIHMDKAIAKQLAEIADGLPLIFTPEPATMQMTGVEMNLSGYGETHRYDPNGVYEVPTYVLSAVEHRMQLKDAWKRSGLAGVNQYIDSVIAKAREAAN